MRVPALALALLVVLGTGCNCDGGMNPDGGDHPDGGAPDAGRPDAGPGDGGTADAGPADAGEVDAGPPVSLVAIGNALDQVLATGSAPQVMGALVAILPDGGLVAAHRPSPGSDVVLSRYNPGSDLWERSTDAGNQRPLTSLLTLAVDPAGMPTTAFIQQQEGAPTLGELVLARDTGSWEQLHAPLPLAGARLGDVAQGTLLIDGAGRPLLTFYGPDDGHAQVLRFEGATVTTLASVFLGFDPRLALEADGTPLLAYLQGVPSSNAESLVVGRVVGSGDGGVELLGGVIDSVPNATQTIAHPRVAVLGSTPWAFWNKDGVVHAARFEGGAWATSDLGEPFLAAFGIAAVAVGNDLLLAGCSDDFTKLKRYHAGAWEPALPVPVSQRCYVPSFAARGTTVYLVTSGERIAEVRRVLLR